MPPVRCRSGHGTGTASPAIGLKFLIDNALPPKLADLLPERGATPCTSVTTKLRLHEGNRYGHFPPTPTIRLRGSLNYTWPPIWGSLVLDRPVSMRPA